jgi:SH3-like domain-containing protein
MYKNMPIYFTFFLMVLITALPMNSNASIENKSTHPDSYYASLKTDEANVRTGPSVRYPIQWVYKKPGWPIQITAKFENWRKIRDVHGEAGWINKNLINSKRNVLINTKGIQEVYRLPLITSSVVFIAESGVIAELLSCKDNWCKISFATQEGWVEAKHLWGVDDNETIK